MAKQWIIPIILILMIIVGIIGYSFYKRVYTSHPPTGLSTPTSSITPIVVSNSLSKVLYTGKTQQCTIQSGNQTVESYHMNGQTVRADFLSPTTKQLVHLYADGEQVYIWVGSETKGSVMDESDANTINTTMQTNGLAGFTISAKRNLKCTPWNVDMSLLGVPYTVSFTSVKQ